MDILLRQGLHSTDGVVVAVSDTHPRSQQPRTPIAARHFTVVPPPGTGVDGASRAHAGYTVPAHRVREFLRMAPRYGWDTRAVLSAVGITAAAMSQPCRDVTADKAAAVLRYLWAATNDEFLGLGPHPVPHETLRVLAFAVSGAPTLGDALSRVQQFAPVFPGVPAPSTSSVNGQTTLSFGLNGFDQTVSLLTDSVLAVAHRIINWGTRRRIHLLRVDVPYARPRGETDHDVVFGAPMRFCAPRAALVFPTCELAAAMVRSQDEVQDLLDDVPAVLLSETDFYTTHTQRVRGIIERCLGDHICTADEIAASMGISRQTLRRRLSEEDTSVSAIRDDVLRTTALDSLSQGGETMAALACRLGFSEPSAFTRAFRRWTGDSPTAFLRRQLRAS
jgi:AraC-like DNA-binding protein